MTAIPAAVTKEIADLRKAVTDVVPARDDHNLLIGSWNLRAFGDLTGKWSAAPNDSPARDWRAVALIAEVISHFDVVAVQEVRRSTTALRFLLERLGSSWGVITSDVTEGDAGNGERLTFLFNTTRVMPSGLVGEIVLPDAAGKPTEQFARTPYAASFVRGAVEFILSTVHITYGTNEASRVPEVGAFAQWMRSWADRPSDWNHNLLVLGDFNIDRIDDPLYQALVSTGLYPPSELSAVPRTIFDNDKTRHFYDQIAWFSKVETAANNAMLQGLRYAGKAGSINFIPHVFAGLTLNQVSWRISDHYPLWIELRTD